MATNFLSQLTGSFAMPEARCRAVLVYWSGVDVDPRVIRRAVEDALGIS